MPRRILLATLLATCGGVAGLAAPSPIRRSPTLASPRHAGVRMESRWPELEKADKAVFEDMEPYKGRVSWGFSDAAEKTNGRVAMMAFTILYLQELFVGTGILTQYGLPYDEGAVVQPADAQEAEEMERRRLARTESRFDSISEEIKALNSGLISEPSTVAPVDTRQPCPNCGRKFLPDRLGRHVKVCEDLKRGKEWRGTWKSPHASASNLHGGPRDAWLSSSFKA